MSAKPDATVEPRSALPTYREVNVRRERGELVEHAMDFVAEESPVALLYQGIPHVVMLASPADLEDLGVGFTLSEGIVSEPSEIRSVELVSKADSLALDVQISAQSFSGLLRRQRNLTGRTGCGLCGIENIEDAIRNPGPVRDGLQIGRAELHAELESLRTHQPLNRSTGSVHAAAWALPGRGIQLVREDVGRHNALDKVIGALVRAGRDCSEGYFIITSRASFEMVQKAAMVGVSFVAAVSAPTALAIDVADRTGVTLIGFARADRHVVYSHPQRLRN
jgi:FdhD protein